MKRDMDLVRRLLLALEEAPYESIGIELDELGIEEYEYEEISYHVILLKEAGLIDVVDASSIGIPNYWVPTRLTWEGHEFLEASRDDDRWNNAKRLMKEKGGGMVFDVLRGLLIHLMTNAVSSS